MFVFLFHFIYLACLSLLTWHEANFDVLRNKLLLYLYDTRLLAVAGRLQKRSALV